MEGRYLLNRGGKLYFRMRVPKLFRKHLGLTEIKHILAGVDLHVAEEKSKLLGQELSTLFKKAASGMVNMELLFPLIKQLCSNILFQDAWGRKKGIALSPNANLCEELRLVMQAYYQGESYDPHMAYELIDYAKNQLKLDVDWNALEMRPMIRNYFLGRMETFRIQKEPAAGNLQNGFDAPFPDGKVSSIFPPSDYCPTLSEKAYAAIPSPLDSLGAVSAKLEVIPATQEADKRPINIFSNIIPSYVEEKKLLKKIDKKAERTLRSHLQLLQEIVGDVDVISVTRSNILDIMGKILPQYPSHRSKRFPKMSLAQVLALKDTEKISENTQKSYFDDWKSFFNWCVTCRYIPFNPMEGLTMEGNELPKDQQKKRFDSEDLTLIFQKIAEMPTQKRFYSELYPFRYWIPLLGLYQGMRSNEICQLHLKDVFAINSIPCLCVTADEEKKQKTKNRQSRRVIPIHSTLLKLGFLQLYFDVAALPRRSNDQLFQALTFTHNGYRRKMDWFNKFIDQFIDDELKTFHSFRHNFDTCLMNRETNVFLVQCLGGYKREGELGERYSVGEIKNMKDTLEKVVYDFDIFAALGKEPLADAVIAEQIKLLPTRRE